MMLRVDLEFNGELYTFRTNNDGCYLFRGLHENRQVRCDSGYNSLKRMKRTIREVLRSEWLDSHESNPPRIHYEYISDGFKK